MKIKGVDIPQAVIDAGNAKMQGEFRLSDVKGAVANSLNQHQIDPFPGTLDDRIGDQLIQAAKKRGAIKYLGGGNWRAL